MQGGVNGGGFLGAEVAAQPDQAVDRQGQGQTASFLRWWQE